MAMESQLKPHPKFSHLEKDFQPIKVCIDFSDKYDIQDSFAKNFKENSDSGHKEAVFSDDYVSYVISPVNDRSKYSENYYICNGLVVVGTDKTTGKNISFITHENPIHTLKDTRSDFLRDVSKQLEQVKSLSKEKSVDAIIVGGNKDFYDDNNTDYEESIEDINRLCNKVLGFSPTIINAPKEKYTGKNDAYFDNENRRLYLYAPLQRYSKPHEDFKPEEMYKRIQEIKNELKTNGQEDEARKSA